MRTETLQVSDEEIEQRIITMFGGEEAAQSEEAQNMAAQLRAGSGRTILESQILREKALDRLIAIVRGQEVPEPVSSATTTTATDTETSPEPSGEVIAENAEPESTPAAQTEEA